MTLTEIIGLAALIAGVPLFVLSMRDEYRQWRSRRD